MLTLINPPFFQSNTEYFNYRRGKFPNLSLALLAGYLENKGINVHIIDAKFNDMGIGDIINILRNNNSKVIGITSNTNEIQNTHILISAIKYEIKNALIILGGIHACALPEETLQANPDLDVVAFTEGEEVLYQLVNDVPLADIDGLVYRDNGQIVRNKYPSLPPTLDGYGPTAYHHWPGAKRFFLTTYRGCPFACSFCFRATGRKPRLRNIEDIMLDLSYLDRVCDIGKIGIADPTFGLNRQHTETFLKEIVRAGFHRRFNFSCTTRVDVITPDLLRKMKDAGFSRVSFGIESGSDRILRSTGKNTHIDQAHNAVKSAKAIGFETQGYYIFGHVDETKSELNKTVEAIWKINTDDISIGIMVPWPGTQIYELAREGRGGYRLLSNDYSKYDKYFGDVMIFDNFSYSYLEIMRIIAYVKLYIYNNRHGDFIHFLKRNAKRVFKKTKHLTRTVLR